MALSDDVTKLTTELAAPTAESAAREMDALRAALTNVLPDTHGSYGGPLVRVVAHYEDGSMSTMYHERFERAHAALRVSDVLSEQESPS